MPEAALKSGWTRVAFGDVVQLSKTRSSDPETDGYERYVGLDHLDPGDLKIRRWGDIADGTTFTSVFRPGQVLFGKRRAYQRKVAVTDFSGVCSGDIYVLEPKSKRLLTELLPFICQSEAFFEHAIGTSAGSLSPRTNWESLATYEFALPPLEEQQRMVASLSAAESYIEALQDFRKSLHDVELGLLDNLIPKVPDETFVTVASLLREGPRNGISPNVNSDGNGLKTVSISAVSDGIFNPSDCVKYAVIDPAAARPFFVRSGDVFLVRGNGNRRLCGTAGLSGQSYGELFYPDLLIRLRFDETKMLPAFAVAQWNMPRVHTRLLSRAKSSNGIWKINGQDVRAHELFVPPIDEQKTIMQRLGEIRRNARNAQAREDDARRLKVKMMKGSAPDE